jgi:hypothetical protein
MAGNAVRRRTGGGYADGGASGSHSSAGELVPGPLALRGARSIRQDPARPPGARRRAWGWATAAMPSGRPRAASRAPAAAPGAPARVRANPAAAPCNGPQLSPPAAAPPQARSPRTTPAC